MMDLCFNHRGEDMDHRYLDTSGAMDARIMLTCIIPLAEIVTDFFDKLKSRSSGFASFEYVFQLSSKVTSCPNSTGGRRMSATKMPDTRRAICPR